MTIEANDAATRGSAAVPEGIELSKGGADVWSPSITPPIGVELTDEQKLACSFRILAREGFSENIAGHHVGECGQLFINGESMGFMVGGNFCC